MNIIVDLTGDVRRTIMDMRDTLPENFTLRYLAASCDDHNPQEIWMTKAQAEELLGSPRMGNLRSYRGIPVVTKYLGENLPK
jgi:hypothetical protein